MSYLSTAIKRARYLVNRDVDQLLVLEKNNGSFVSIVLDTRASRDAAITTAVSNQLATALGDDPNFATTVTTALGDRLKWKGAWAPAFNYVRNDFVMFNGGIYVAPANFTSGASFTKANWIELSPQTGAYAANAQMAAVPDMLLIGVITRDANGAAIAGTASWPDGATGVYTGTASTTFLGAIDSYTITHVLDGVTTTYTQPTVTRDAITGAVTTRPAITIS